MINALVRLDEKSIGLVAVGLDECSYSKSKGTLIKRLSVSELKLNHLLMELTLTDRSPSQLLLEMKQLGGDKVGTSELLKRTQAILAFEGSESLEVLANTADKIYEVHARPDEFNFWDSADGGIPRGYHL